MNPFPTTRAAPAHGRLAAIISSRTARSPEPKASIQPSPSYAVGPIVKTKINKPHRRPADWDRLEHRLNTNQSTCHCHCSGTESRAAEQTSTGSTMRGLGGGSLKGFFWDGRWEVGRRHISFDESNEYAAMTLKTISRGLHTHSYCTKESGYIWA
ncbi:hypothetical protein VTN96DRAFT_8759 [Rasamsonia emersonii]